MAARGCMMPNRGIPGEVGEKPTQQAVRADDCIVIELPNAMRIGTMLDSPQLSDLETKFVAHPPLSSPFHNTFSIAKRERERERESDATCSSSLRSAVFKLIFHF